MSTAHTEVQETKLELLAVEIESAIQITIDSIFRIGHALNEARAEFGENDKAFGQWRQKRLPWLSRANALRFMQVDRRLRDKLLHHSDAVDIRQKALYLLAAPSTPDEVVEKAMDAAKAGDTVTTSDVKQWKDEIQKLKKQHREQQESLKTTVATLRLDLKNRSDRNSELTRELQEHRQEKAKADQGVLLDDLEEWKRRAMAAEKKERAITESLMEIQQERNSLRTHVQDLENRDPLVIEMEKESSTTPFPILPMAMLFTLLDEMETGLKSSQRVGINNDELNAVRNRILRMVATIEEALTALNQPFSQWGE